MIRRLAGIQSKLLTAAFAALRPGGTLVYSTCSLEPDENEAVISQFLEQENAAEVEDITLSIKRSPPMLKREGKVFDKRVGKALRIWPQDNNTDGFFVCKMTKIA